MLTPAQAAGVTRGVLAVSFAILAVFNILPGAEASWSAWLSDHPVLGDISNQALGLALAAAVYQLAIAGLLGIPMLGARLRRVGYGLVGGYAIGNLLILVSNSNWLSPMADNQAFADGHILLIASVLPGLALWAAGFEHDRMFTARRQADQSLARHLIVTGLILVLMYIGLTKIWPTPADYTGQRFAASLIGRVSGEVWGPWILKVLGVIQIVTALALSGFWYSRRFLRVGLILGAFWIVWAWVNAVTSDHFFHPEIGSAWQLGDKGEWALKTSWAAVALLAILSERRRRRR